MSNLHLNLNNELSLSFELSRPFPGNDFFAQVCEEELLQCRGQDHEEKEQQTHFQKRQERILGENAFCDVIFLASEDSTSPILEPVSVI